MKWQKIQSLFFPIFIFGVHLYAQSSWNLQKEKDGIRISNRHTATSSFNDVRVELDVPGTIDQLASILEDIPNYTKWAYATKISRLVKQLGTGSLIYYSEIEVPWPATNRFFYARFEIKKDSAQGTMQLLSTNLPGYQPEPKDLVVVPFSRGVWNIRKLSEKSIHIDYVLELNPGGSLPAWILNLFSTKGPLETFENIKQKMTKLNQR